MGHADSRTTQRYTHHRARPEEARRLERVFRVPATTSPRDELERVDAHPSFDELMNTPKALLLDVLHEKVLRELD
jgi:hypothetical protein